jgi:hypothetical protein
MIIHTIYKTRGREYCGNIYKQEVVRTKEGYFLFGFIPLYIITRTLTIG